MRGLVLVAIIAAACADDKKADDCTDGGQCGQDGPVADAPETDAPAPDARGPTPLPSNGLDLGLLSADVAGAVLVPAGENWVMNTATGEILRCATAVIRPAGEGVAGGIGFARVAAPGDGVPLGVFAVDSLTIAPGAQLYAVGDGGIVVLSRGAVTL